MKPFLNPNYILPALLLLLPCSGANAQNVVFSANANAAKIGLSDQFQVTYTVQDAEGLQSITPALKDFKLLGGPFQSQSSSTQIVGNRMTQSTSISLTYVLQAKHTGTIILLPAIAKDAAGHSYQSNSLQVEVVPGSVAVARPRRSPAASSWADDDPFGNSDPFAALRQQSAMLRQMRSQPGQQQQPANAPRSDISKDIFIRVDVDKRAVKLGEQITAAYKLYARVPMQVGISKLPSLNGFWTQDFDIPKQPKPVEEIINGKRYQVFLLKKSALFPRQSGTLVLDAAEAEGTVRIADKTQRSNSIFDDPFLQQAFGGSLMMSDPFFSNPFGEQAYEDVPVHLKSTPVSIAVSNLPEKDKPADFTGAVGAFSLSAKMDKSALTTDDVATLRVTISGSGNLKLFDAPKLVLPAGLDTYEPNILDTITGRSTTISGEKVITYSIAPRRTGDFVIPPVTLAWYDPRQGTYQHASTASYTIHVKPGKSIAAAAPAGTDGTDIHDALLAAPARSIILSPLYWSMYAVPLLALVGITFYRRREDELREDNVQLRNKRANKIAQKRLAAAGAMLQKGDARNFYDELSKALWLYLSDKLAIPISALGKAAAAQAMTARGIPSSVQQQIEQVLSECELALYAPAGNSHQMQQTFSEAAAIITSLERTLRTS